MYSEEERTMTEVRVKKFAAWKWLLVFAIIFTAALPISMREAKAAGETYTVSVSKGYLALRTWKEYNSANEIGELYSGDQVQVYDYSDATYWYVYSPKYGKYGYVNKNYLYYSGGSSSSSSAGPNYTVSVSKGYLALRTAMAYDSSNEIGELYSGDTVQYISYGNDTYWYVYSPKHGKYGYVNRNYLIGGGSSSSSSSSGGSNYTVSVSKGYLALRTAMAYDSSNEIGELYSGDTVQYISTGNSTYWYVYSPKYGKYGYVNKNYLIGASSSSSSSSYSTWTVSVSKGYLALRTWKEYNSANEIGELYTGDKVYVYDSSDSTYWYVYSPKHGKYGYVNRNYLY